MHPCAGDSVNRMWAFDRSITIIPDLVHSGRFEPEFKYSLNYSVTVAAIQNGLKCMKCAIIIDISDAHLW